MMTAEQRAEAAQKIAEQRHLGQREHNSKCPHEVIDRKVEEFLANGGEITVMPSNEPDLRNNKPCRWGSGSNYGDYNIGSQI